MQAPTPTDDRVIPAVTGATAELAIWLASPLARGRFDPGRLSARDAERARAIRNPARAEEFATSRALLQYVAATSGAAQSLSHSGRHAAVALAPAGTRVGVDIEQHRPRDLHGIAHFAFAPTEAAALSCLEGAALEQAFYSRWVMKEALAKALQLSLLEASRQCVFTEASAGWCASVPCDQPWEVIAYEPFPGLSLAVALIGTMDLPTRTCEWPPTHRGDWRVIARLTSALEKSPPPAESSTCREMLPTS